MLIVIMGTFRIAPDRLGEARPAMEAMITASRAEAGCLAYAYADDLVDPGLIRVSEIWESRAALAAHLESDHIATWRAQWPVLGIGARELALYPASASEPF